MMRAWLAIGLLVLSACAKEEEVPQFILDWRAAQASARRGLALASDGHAAEAKQAFLESYRLAADVLKTIDEGRASFSRETPARHVLLCHLSEVGRWIGSEDPYYAAQSARLAYRAVREAPDQPETWGVWGSILFRTGYLDRALDTFRKHLETLPEGSRSTAAIVDVVEIMLARGHALLAEGAIGCEKRARDLFDQALEIAPDPRVRQSLGDLNRKYADEINAAAKAGDAVALGRIHARYGFFDLAKENLKRAVDRAGFVSEIRWTLARYYYEGLLTKDSLAEAAKIYEEFLDAGERVEEATVAWVRVKRRQGEVARALTRFGATKDPSEELRIELIVTRFDRVLSVPENDRDTWRRESREIDRLFAGPMPDEKRADLLVEMGFLCLRTRDEDRLARIVNLLRRDRPDDARRYVLEGGLMDLRGDPIVPDEQGSPNGD